LIGGCKLRKATVILIAIMLFIIVGCSNQKVTKHNYTYEGENEFWTAEYKVTGTETVTEKDNKISCESKSNNLFIVTYKKDVSELSSVKHLEISYKSSVGGGKSTADFDDDSPKRKTYTMSSGSTNGSIENKDEVIEVTIDIDGELQTFELKNEQ
jgi:hypothetical protein